MRITMRLIPFAIALVLLLGLVASAYAQGPKIGYVDDQRLRAEYKAFVDAQEKWNVESVAWEEEAASKQVELQELVEEYEKQKLILSDEKRREREAAIRAKEEALDAYTRQIYGPGGSGESLQQRLMTPIIEKLNTAIEAVSVELAYDLVFNSQGLVYAKDGLDLTDKVLEYLEENEQ